MRRNGRALRGGAIVEELPIEADVTYLPPERTLDFPELLSGMRDQAIENRNAYSGSPSTLTPEQEAGVDMYRARQGVRDRELQLTMGEDFPEALRQSRQFRAAKAVVDAEYGRRAPAAMLGQIAGMAEQSGGGGMLGRIRAELQQRLIGQYRDSVLATLGEVGSHSPEYLAGPNVPRSVRLLESAAPPVTGPIRNTGPATEASVRSAIAPAVSARAESIEDRDRSAQIARAGTSWMRDASAEPSTVDHIEDYYLSSPLYAPGDAPAPQEQAPEAEDPSAAGFIEDYYMNDPRYGGRRTP